MHHRERDESSISAYIADLRTLPRVKKNPEWWLQHIKIAKTFYFSALLAELKSPRYRKGGIREHVNFTL